MHRKRRDSTFGVRVSGGMGRAGVRCQAPGSAETPRGLALVVVLVLSMVILVGATALWRMSQSDIPRIQLNVARAQAQFLARGGLQLAGLKSRLLSTALYDAAAYAQGKNPYFDHSPTGYANFNDSGADRNVWSGPLFFSGTAAYNPPDRTYARSLLKDVTFNGSEGSDDQDGGAWICEKYIKKFIADLRSGVNQIVIDPAATDPITGVADPFTGQFEVSDAKVLGLMGGQRWGEEAVQFVVRATVNARVVGATTDFRRDFTVETTGTYRVARQR